MNALEEKQLFFKCCRSLTRDLHCVNRNYSASYALGVEIALLFTCQLHESLIKLYFKQFSIFQLKF